MDEKNSKEEVEMEEEVEDAESNPLVDKRMQGWIAKSNPRKKPL